MTEEQKKCFEESMKIILTNPSKRISFEKIPRTSEFKIEDFSTEAIERLMEAGQFLKVIFFAEIGFRENFTPAPCSGGTTH